MYQSTQTNVLLKLLRNQSTPLPDEHQQKSGQNIAIHMYVLQSWDKGLNSAIISNHNGVYVDENFLAYF